MTGVARITKLDFFIMKSQGISYLSLVAVILLFGLMGSSITVLCITGAWFIALMATNIFAIQEKNHLDRLYGSVCVSLNEVVLGRYTFVFLNYFTSMVVIIILYLGFVLCRKATFDVPDIMLGLGLSFLVFSTITGIQILDFLVGVGKQGGVGSGQRIKQFFNLGLYLCKLHLIGGNLWIDFSLAAPKQFELPELFSHSCENELILSISVDR